MKKQYILASFFIFIMFGVCFVDFTKAASSTVSITVSDLNIDSVGTLPTSNFYFLKQWGRSINRFFTFNSIAKAELELKITNQMAAEALEVEKISPNDTKALKNALDNYTDAQERLNARLASLTETSKNPNIEKLLKEVDEKTTKHIELLGQLSERWSSDPYAEDTAKKLSTGDPDFDLLIKIVKDAQSNAEKTFNNATILTNPEVQKTTDSKVQETSVEQSTRIIENEFPKPLDSAVVVPTTKPILEKTETSQPSMVETKTTPVSSDDSQSTTIKESEPAMTEPSATQDQTLDTKVSAPEAASETNTSSASSIEMTQAKTYEVPIISFAFNPKTLTINKGDTVVWTNNDSAPHDVTGSNSKSLSSPTLSKGQTFSFTFNEPGTFEYYCSIHPMMKGSIIVK